ncbi:hypothetical protein [Teredinibacter purpureus]|uniref:hypothetical protein n=1 Tax=Teredinibacter purpureus TaxID=2731756 RepID=UPI0005F8404C|nr:hypothetical protein [Teredinibacter purpureus]
MSKFIRSIGKCAVNGIGFDIYENKNGSATIRPTKMNSDLPRKFWKTFDGADKLESFIDQHDNQHLTGAGLVQALKDGPFSWIFD